MLTLTLVNNKLSSGEKKMKKILLTVTFAVMLLGLVMFSFAVDTSPSDPGGSGGDGCSCTHYKRTEDPCDFAPFHKKVLCTTGGTMQCTTKNCP